MKSKTVSIVGLLLGAMLSMTATASGGGYETPPPETQPVSVVNNNNPEANAHAASNATTGPISNDSASNAAANATTGPINNSNDSASTSAANATTGPVTVNPVMNNAVDLANQNSANAAANQDQAQQQTLENRNTLNNAANASNQLDNSNVNKNENALNSSNTNNVETGDQNVHVMTGDTNVNTGDVNTRVDNDVNNTVKNDVDVNITGPVVHGGAGGAGGQGGKGGEGGDANSHSNSSVGNVSATGGHATGGNATGGSSSAVVERGAVVVNPTTTSSANGGSVANSGNSSATGGSVSGSGNSTNDNHSASSSSSGVTGSGNSAVSITYQAPKTYKPIPGVAYASPVGIPNEAIIAVKGVDETKMRAQIELALNELAPFSAERVFIRGRKGESGTSDVSWDLRGTQKGVRATALIPMSLKDARFSTASYRVLSIGRAVGRVSKADRNSVTSNVSDLFDSALELKRKGYFRGNTQVFMVLIPCLLRVDEGTSSTGMSAGGNAGSAHAAGSTVNSIAGALGLGKGSTMQTERSVVYAVVVAQAEPSDALSVTFQQLGGVVGSLSTPEQTSSGK